jgi:hypothetical protein
MKQTFTLMVLLLLSLAVSGQNSYQKSSDQLKQSLDTVNINYWDSNSEIWEYSNYCYTYDSLGRTILYLTTYMDYDNNTFQGEERYEYKFNPDGSMAEYLYLQWDEDSADWENDAKDVYYYTSSGNQAGYVSYNWDRNSEQWNPDDSIYNDYNVEGLISEYQGFERKSDQWIIRYYSSYSYEAHGWLNESVHRMWYEDDQEWKNNTKWVYSYNGQGELLSKTRYDQEVYEGAWVEESRLEMIYDSEGKLSTTNSSLWETDQWVLYRTDTMTYNPSNMLVEDRGYYLDEGNMRPNFIYEYSYDENENLTEYIQYSWDRNLLDIQPYAKSTYTYDLNYSMSDLLLPSVEDLDWDTNHFPQLFSNMPLGIHIYHWENDSWEDYMTRDYVYSEMNVHVVGSEQEDMAMLASLYPNPVNDLLQVDLPEGTSSAMISLYEITGRQVMRRHLEAGQSLSLSYLPPGIYLYNLSVDGKIQSGKLVKR